MINTPKLTLSTLAFQTMASAVSSDQGKLFVAVGLTAVAYYAIKHFFLPFQSLDTPPKPLESLGHFTYATHPQHYQGAIQVVGKIFDRLADPTANNGWDWIYLSQKEEILKSDSLTKAQGSCYGNCCALGKAIIKRGRILTAAELQAIESNEKFPKRAMGFQLIDLVGNEIERRYVKTRYTPAAERPFYLTEEEKTTLGERAVCFGSACYVQCLKTYGLSFLDVSQMPLEKFLTLWRLLQLNVPFEWAKQEFKMPNATAQELLDWATTNFPDRLLVPTKMRKVRVTHNNHPELIYPKSPTMTKFEHLESFNFWGKVEKSQLITKCPDIEKAHFAGFFIIEGEYNEEKKPGHVVLLEIDNLKNLYVFYDNNMEFYTGQNLEACLYRLQLLWDHYKYPFARFHPYIYERAEIKA
jgi:hypothetical protein